MKRLLETRLGMYSQQKLRGLEKRVFPEAAKERNFYEWQEQTLRNPATRETYVNELRGKVRMLLPENLVPEMSLLEKYQPKPETFLRRGQVFDSDHNIAHHAIVMTGSIIGARYLRAQNPEAHVDEEAVLVASALHDTQRKGDRRESVIGLQGHGKRAERKASYLMHALGIDHDNPQTLALIRQMVRYHDVDRKQLGPKYTPELGVMVASDRAALERLFSSRHASTQFVSGRLTATRMREFKNGGIASDPKLFAMLTEILGALDIMTKEKIAKGNKMQQFHYVMESAKELGIVKDSSQTTSSAA